MGKNVGPMGGHRVGKVRGVFQKYNASLDRYQKYNAKDGRLISTKHTSGPYKGVEEVH